MTAKRFSVKNFCVYEDDNPIGMNLRDCCKKLNELYEEREYWKQQAEKRFERIRELEEMIE